MSEQELSDQNLLPIYLIEDKLQANFKKINTFMKQVNSKFVTTNADIDNVKKQQINIKFNIKKQMNQMQRRIVDEISKQLQGRIAVALSKTMDNFSLKMEHKMKGSTQMKAQFEKKLATNKQQILYQTSVENQKIFNQLTKKIQQVQNQSKQIKRIQSPNKSKAADKPKNKKQIQKSEQSQQQSQQQSQSQEQSENQNQSKGQTKTQAKIQIQAQTQNQNQKQTQAEIKSQSKNQAQSPKQKKIVGKQSWQELHHMIKQLQSRIISLEDFSVSVDKRFYNGMTSVKDSCKQITTQLLNTKKNVQRKIDQVKTDLMKIKNTKQLQAPTGKIEDEFKRKLTQKFAQVYKLLGSVVNKNEIQMSLQKLDSQIARHDDQFIQIRNQLATNNQYFTFYSKNASREDLKQQIDDLSQKFIDQNNSISNTISAFKDESNDKLKQMNSTCDNIKQLQQKVKALNWLNQNVELLKQKVQSLEQFNRFGPQKLQKIHNVLDNDLTASQRQLIDIKIKKNSFNSVEQSQKQLKNQLSKIKDQLFLLHSQSFLKQQDFAQIKSMFKQMDTKIDKIKGENQQAMLSRKPWVCLSCDKEKQKEQVKKQSKSKRLQPFKGFSQQRSEKNLKVPPVAPVVPPSPLFQERFEVYDRLRQKYLSDTIRLPQILKEKLKDREPSMP